MNTVNCWRLCLEIGLNHIGLIKNVIDILNVIHKQNIQCAVSIQIREEEFYSDGREKLKLSLDDYCEIRKMCSNFEIPFGLALGPLKDIDWILGSNLKPDFIKILGMATKNTNFVDSLNRFNCDKYFSVGLSSLDFIESEIIPRMKKDDALIHTSISHSFQDQNLIEIKALERMGKKVFFGQHSDSLEVCFTAIGMGASKIFAYIGNKKFELPDHEHAVSLTDAKKFYDQCMVCFGALGSIRGDVKTSKIDFIG